MASKTLLWLSTAGFAAGAAAILWVGDSQPYGMIRHWTNWAAYSQRLWPLAAMLAACLALASIWQRADTRLPASLRPPWPALLVLLGLAGALAVVWVLRAYPNSGDEYAFVFQARTFLAGRLWNPVVPHHELFSFNHIVEKDGKWVTEYPPGWPALLAAAGLGGLPFWLMCPLLGAALLALLARYCRRLDGPGGAIVALALIVPTPFFLFNAGSYFSQVPAALSGLLFCHAALIFLERPRPGPALSAGAALGLLGLIRPFDVIIFALPFAVQFLRRARRPHWRLAPAIVAGGVPFLAAYLAYNAAVTGDPFLPVVNWGSPLLRIGFHMVEANGEARSLADTLGEAIAYLIEFAEWTSPLLALAYALALPWQALRRRLSFADFVFPLAVAAYLFYPSVAGNRYGPRYYFDVYPQAIATIASAAVALLGQSRWRAWARSLLAVHMLACLIEFGACALFFCRIVDERMDMYDQARAQNLHEAVIIVHSPAGVLRFQNPEDLTRNGIDPSGDVVFALDLPGGREALRAMYPQRRFYIYRREASQPRGDLAPLS